MVLYKSCIINVRCIRRTNHHAIAVMFVHPSVYPSLCGRVCIMIMVCFSTDLSLWLDSPVLLQSHILPAVFFQFHLEERWGMDVQTRWSIIRL